MPMNRNGTGKPKINGTGKKKDGRNKNKIYTIPQ
jgi:hypothetical protein